MAANLFPGNVAPFAEFRRRIERGSGQEPRAT